MRKLIIAAMLAASVPAQATEALHPRDAEDIQAAAKYATVAQMVKTSLPIKNAAGYSVQVEIVGKICTVQVRQFQYKELKLSPAWVADTPVCKGK